MVISLPPTIFAHTTFFNTTSRYVCIVMWPDGQFGRMDFWYSVCLLGLNYVIPLAVLVVTYVRVGLNLWGSQVIGEYTHSQTETIKSKRRVSMIVGKLTM